MSLNDEKQVKQAFEEILEYAKTDYSPKEMKEMQRKYMRLHDRVYPFGGTKHVA